MFVKYSIHVLSIFVCAALPTWAAPFNAASEFSGSNPSGVWSYGYAAPANLGSLSGNVSGMPTYIPACDSGGGFQANCWIGGGASVVGPNGTFQSGTVRYTSGYLNLHPASDLTMAVLVFTAPATATYLFTGEFTDHDLDGGDGVDVSALLGNGTFLLSTTTMPAVSNPVAINFSRALGLGESVYFTAGARGSYVYDSTGLSLQVAESQQSSPIPEPGSFALAGLGAAALWLKRRYRS